MRWSSNGGSGIVWSVRNRAAGAEIWDIVSDVLDVGSFSVGNVKLVLAMILIEIEYGVLWLSIYNYIQHVLQIGAVGGHVSCGGKDESDEGEF